MRSKGRASKSKCLKADNQLRAKHNRTLRKTGMDSYIRPSNRQVSFLRGRQKIESLVMRGISINSLKKNYFRKPIVNAIKSVLGVR